MGYIAIMYSNYWFIKTLAAHVKVLGSRESFVPELLQ